MTLAAHSSTSAAAHAKAHSSQRPTSGIVALAAPALKCGELSRVLQTLDAAMMKRFPVSSAVNDPQNDTLECIEEVPEFVSAQATLF